MWCGNYRRPSPQEKEKEEEEEGEKKLKKANQSKNICFGVKCQSQDRSALSYADLTRMKINAERKMPKKKTVV
jgi:hypothetical protein